MRVLGVDLASASWSDNGSAVIEFDAGRFASVRAPAFTWPNTPLTPTALAASIHGFCESNQIAAVALDGPQGWRDPSTPSTEPGVGRRCEWLCKTQGKTGVHPRTYPSTQRGWIEFCVTIFDELLHTHGSTLFEGRRRRGLQLLECFPTSTWRASGLKPLPGKGKKPSLGPFVSALRRAYRLPPLQVRSHDDLQAVVAALCAAGAMGGPCSAAAHGVPARTAGGHRVEGFIWNAQP
ncbi:MAG: DUF429 domain-containing protein [Archangiaceae bacterium]|nr:DUF429 domain-containing protein [Archangiaceae bacterium]